jgi:hypothetical protein
MHDLLRMLTLANRLRKRSAFWDSLAEASNRIRRTCDSAYGRASKIDSSPIGPASDSLSEECCK